MDAESVSVAVLDFVLLAENFYSNLAHVDVAQERSHTISEMSLGGKLLYAGELDEAGRAFTVAGNVAGAATLAATADVSAQTRAVREGTVDFLVTSLDEALRILKNEIRKKETAAVCVAIAPESLEGEMDARGVQVDLLRPRVDVQLGWGLSRMQAENPEEGGVLLTLEVSGSPAASMSRLDSIARECLPEDAVATRRWLRLAPRYLGRPAQGIRVLRCDLQTAKQVAARVKGAIESGEIGVRVQIQILAGDEIMTEIHSPMMTRDGQART